MTIWDMTSLEDLSEDLAAVWIFHNTKYLTERIEAAANDKWEAAGQSSRGNVDRCASSGYKEASPQMRLIMGMKGENTHFTAPLTPPCRKKQQTSIYDTNVYMTIMIVVEVQ